MATSKNSIVISRLVQKDRWRILVSAIIAVNLQAFAIASVYLSWSSEYGDDSQTSPINNITAEVIFEMEEAEQKLVEEIHKPQKSSTLKKVTAVEKTEMQKLVYSLPKQEEAQAIVIQKQEDHIITPILVETEKQDILQSATNVTIAYRPVSLQTIPKPKKKVKVKSSIAQTKSASVTKNAKSQWASKQGKGRCRFPNIQITRADKQKIKRQTLVRIYTNNKRKITKATLLRSSGYKAFDQKFIRAVKRSRCPQGNRYYDLAPAYK